MPSNGSMHRARNFLLKIYSELIKRTENCEDLLKKIGFCTPQFVLSPVNKKSFFELPENIYKTEKAEQQYRLIGQYNWNEICGQAINTMKPSRGVARYFQLPGKNLYQKKITRAKGACH